MTTSWVFLSTLNYDGRSTTHQIYNFVIPDWGKQGKSKEIKINKTLAHKGWSGVRESETIPPEFVGWYSSVGIATRYWMAVSGVESRWGGGRLRLSATFQIGPGKPGVKRPGRGLDYPPQPKSEVEERVEFYIYSHSGPSWTVLRWTLPLLLRLELQKEWYISSINERYSVQIRNSYQYVRAMLQKWIIMGLKHHTMVRLRNDYQSAVNRTPNEVK